jgi:hypothetical protein
MDKVELDETSPRDSDEELTKPRDRLPEND